MDKLVQLLIVVVFAWLGWQFFAGVMAHRAPVGERPTTDREWGDVGRRIQLRAAWSDLRIPAAYWPRVEELARVDVATSPLTSASSTSTLVRPNGLAPFLGVEAYLIDSLGGTSASRIGRFVPSPLRLAVRSDWVFRVVNAASWSEGGCLLQERRYRRT